MPALNKPSGNIIKCGLALTLALILWGALTTQLTRTRRACSQATANVGPAVGVNSVWYDGALGSLPAAQGQLTFGTTGPTEVLGDGATSLDTTAQNDYQAGWSHGPPWHSSPTLDRDAGYAIRFTLQITSEDHTSSGTADKDGDGVADRAGFSVLALSSDGQGIELGFWEDRVWAQEDGTAYPPTGTLFTHAEEGLLDTTAGRATYELTIAGGSYSLAVSDTAILSGSLRDYRAFGGLPYILNNFVYFGDNTTSANGNLSLAYVSLVLNAAPPDRSTAAHTPLVIGDLGVLDVDAGGNSVAVTMTVANGALYVNANAPGGLSASDVSGNGGSAVTLSGSIGRINNTLASSPALTYTPQANFFGTDALTVAVNDNGHSGSGGALSDSKSFALNVLGADVRLAKSVAPLAALPGDSITYTLAYSNAGNVTASGVVVTDWPPAEVTLNLTGFKNLSGLAWQIGNLSPGEVGAITITGQLSSPLGAGRVLTNVAAITATNDANPANNAAQAALMILNSPPVAQDDAYATDHATPLAVNAPGVLGNDSDANGEALTATLLPGTLQGGALELNLDGSFVYTPAAGFSGLDQFFYLASDGQLADVAIVSIDVGPAPTFTLTIAVDGSGGGAVEPGVGQHVYEWGTVVTLTAMPDLDSEFSGWSGALAGTTSPLALVMNSDQVVTATFDLRPVLTPTYVLTALVSPPGSGEVLLNPPGGVYRENSVVQLTANPFQGYEFARWSGDLTGAASPATITMTQDVSVTAHLETVATPTYTLAALVNPPGSGEVLLNPPGGVYRENSVVQLTANPFQGYEFARWSGDLTGAVSPATITMTQDVSVVAMFAQSGFSVYLPLALKQ